MFTKKGKHFVTIFLNAITTSATVAIAAAFENASKTGVQIFFQFPRALFANEVYGHKVKVQKYEILYVLIFVFKGRAGAACFVSSTGRAKNFENVRRRPYGTKMYGKLNYLAISIPLASLCLRLTSFSKRLSITSIIQPKLFGYKCGTCVQWILNHLPSQDPCRKKAVMLICYALTIPELPCISDEKRNRKCHIYQRHSSPPLLC